MVFDDFDEFTIETAGGRIFGVHAGTGPAVLLLHGMPQTHLMWRYVAPRLAGEFTVVATDLRGYGASGFPGADGAEGAGGGLHGHSMRSLAVDQVSVMRELGFPEFSVVGHDRGARCAYRMALDHPDTINALAVMDVIPTADAYARADRDFALGYWVWSFLAAPSPVPERLIAGDPDAFVDHLLDTWSDNPRAFDPEARRIYREQFHDPGRVHAICEQYRAAATADIEHDEHDRGRQLSIPVLVLWSSTGAVNTWYDPLEIWRSWATDVSGAAVPAGHFLPEEAPDTTLESLTPFLRTAIAGPATQRRR
ncbi:alpha/beta fold hydrolase [Kribbella pratensis]|uniref:Haloacetate dehalogenase n=1 Tax=Kribbella pratensis TaxID=2512112 RepID=A0A4R8CNY3_9ACTN|nr:alpha/beta hydrolase [Kribbella pratensis]TDW77831.1 haloacetate dehalogenase [Kribbella pratensis]